MTTCKSIGPLLDGYHDRELGSLERWRVDRHLVSCDACRRDLASLDTVGDVVRASVAGVADADVWSAIASQLPARTGHTAPLRRRRPARLRRTLLPGLAAAVAAATAAVFLSPDSAVVPGEATLAASGVADPGGASDADGASGVVRSVYAPLGAVMVMEAEKRDDPTIIWLMDPPSEMQEVSSSVGI